MSIDDLFDFICNGLKTFNDNTETVIISLVDSSIRELDIDLYDLLINEFNVNPSVFRLRIPKVTITTPTDDIEYITFFREIKLRNLLDSYESSYG